MRTAADVKGAVREKETNRAIVDVLGELASRQTLVAPIFGVDKVADEDGDVLVPMLAVVRPRRTELGADVFVERSPPALHFGVLNSLVSALQGVSIVGLRLGEGIQTFVLERRSNVLISVGFGH